MGFAQTDKQQEKASRQTHTKVTAKLTKRSRTEKHRWKRAKYNHVQEKAKKKKKETSEADFFRNMKVKICYTLKDGHVGRDM
jgi:hypothetical protein